MTHDQEVQVLARQTALTLRSEFGEELPSAVDEILDPSPEREEIYDLAIILAAAALVVACAQLLVQILDRERKSTKGKTDREAIRIEIIEKIQIEHVEEVKLVPDIERIVDESITNKGITADPAAHRPPD